MTIAVDWDIQQQIKLTDRQTSKQDTYQQHQCHLICNSCIYMHCSSVFFFLVLFCFVCFVVFLFVFFQYSIDADEEFYCTHYICGRIARKVSIISRF